VLGVEEVVRLPLFQLTGGSAAVRAHVCRHLPAVLTECVVLDQEILPAGLPWEQHRRTWLRVALSIHQGGRSTVLVGTQLPEHYERLPERAAFTRIHYLALVGNGKADRRVLPRPARPRAADDRVVDVQSFDDWLRANAARTMPPMTLLETNEAEPAETVAAVAAWVRAALLRDE
jgi:hypothetical protein